MYFSHYQKKNQRKLKLENIFSYILQFLKCHKNIIVLVYIENCKDFLYFPIIENV